MGQSPLKSKTAVEAISRTVYGNELTAAAAYEKYAGFPPGFTHSGTSNGWFEYIGDMTSFPERSQPKLVRKARAWDISKAILEGARPIDAYLPDVKNQRAAPRRAHYRATCYERRGPVVMTKTEIRLAAERARGPRPASPLTSLADVMAALPDAGPPASLLLLTDTAMELLDADAG